MEVEGDLMLWDIDGAECLTEHHSIHLLETGPSVTKIFAYNEYAVTYFFKGAGIV